jgi:class 3 adenylate cyclase
MTDFTRVISISTLLFLAFFCFQTGVFLCSGFKLKQNNRRSLIFIEFFTGFLLLFDALAYIYRGNTTVTGWYMVRISNFFVFVCNLSAAFFFCFYVCEFIKQTRLNFSILLKPKSSIKNDRIPSQLFIVLFLCLFGIILTVISQFTNLFYYFDENNIYHRSALYPLSVVLGFLPGLITLTMLLQNRKQFQKNVFVSLLIYFVLPLIGVILILLQYGFSWINISLGLGALHLFFSSIKLMELEFYSDKRDSSVLSPVYKTITSVSKNQKRINRNHLYQTLSVSLGGILLVLLIVSIKGVSLPEKTLTIEEPYSENDNSKNVCITFARNAEKHWVDEADPDRTGAQYDGVIFNNMKSTIITDWNFSISVPEGCSVDPGPWNGIFTLSTDTLNVIKPHAGDKENVHGEDFYTITPLKTLGFGCIMYAPHDYEPLSQKIEFTYSSVLKPLTNVFFDAFLALIFVAFIISTTLMIFEGKLIRVEEENKKLENTVKERTKELEEEKNRSESLLLNILPKEIARELTAHPDRTLAKEYPNVTVLFTDIVGFTKISGEMSAEEVVTMLNKMFTLFDERAQREGIEKIKTIGDAYMAAAGLTQEGKNDGAEKMVRFAKGLLEDVHAFNETSSVKLLIRLGLNSGPLVAGVIGKTKFIYDIWGDTVNVASRMESTGLPMKIHVTENTKVQTEGLYSYSENTEIDVKGKGMMKTYFL